MAECEKGQIVKFRMAVRTLHKKSGRAGMMFCYVGL